MINRFLHDMTSKTNNNFLFGLVLFFMLFGAACPAPAGQTDGRTHFRRGVLGLEKGRLEEAARDLLIAQQEFPLLGDYACLHLSDAYHRMGDHQKALDAVRDLLNNYPQSTLVRKARSAEIREAKKAEEGSVLKLYEAFVKDYPDDHEAAMAYALYLKQHDAGSKAAPILKGLYVKGYSPASSALNELNPREILAADLLDRARNLIDRYDFREAERDLWKALEIDDGSKKEEILRNLGLSLFRQKEYRNAALIYEQANDLYSKSRSLYRAGDKEGFENTLKLLLERKDKRAGGLLLAAATDRRRAGDHQEAVKLYNDVRAKYPSEGEDALWGVGWTHYLAADYRKAAEVFAGLFLKYDEPKYRYWQARSVESLGEDASGLYNSISGIGNNYYAFMAQLRVKGRIIPAAYTEPQTDIQGEQRWRDRVEALIGLDMPKDAVHELTCMVKKIGSQADLLYIVSTFYRLGEYRRAISLATKMPYSEGLYRHWYPLAYWDEVSSVTKKHDLDPLVALSVMREESRFDAGARSAAGARGLMQIMPQTAYRLDRTLRLGIHKETQIHDVRSNISLGVFYLKSLFSEFGSMAHALAAYNAGEAAVRRWEEAGNYRTTDEFIEDIPYAETKNYVKKVLTSYFQYKKTSPAETWDLMLGKL